MKVIILEDHEGNPRISVEGDTLDYYPENLADIYKEVRKELNKED